MLHRKVEEELIPFCEKYDLGVLPYFPLANGFLTGKYKKGKAAPSGSRLQSDGKGMFTEENFEFLENLRSFGNERGKSVLDLAFAWLLKRKAVSSVIAGATTVDQVIANAATAEWELSNEEYKTVTDIIP